MYYQKPLTSDLLYKYINAKTDGSATSFTFINLLNIFEASVNTPILI
jgi:hypothetical protein